ncbi:hypothetical protein GUITHDRAFT_80137, partial [Guillardia theta CCMP2712]
MLSFLKDLWTTACAGKVLLANEYVSFSACLGGHKTLGNKLFIRECYLEMRRDKESTQTCDPMILTGTPGIGKSCFAYFLL